MKFHQIRNATVKIEYAGSTFLVDPWLAPKGRMGTFRDFAMYVPTREEQLDLPMPMTELPSRIEDILSGVNALLMTHVHPDHVDMAMAMAMDGTIGAPLPKELPVFCQNEQDAQILATSGFTNVEVLGSGTTFGRVSLEKRPGIHGTLKPCGPTCGVLFRAEGEKTLYLAGDTIYCDEVERTLVEEKPDVVVLNACDAKLVDNGRLIMDDADVEGVALAAPDAIIVASHMGAVAHACLAREELKARLANRGIERVLVPEDGEMLSL